MNTQEQARRLVAAAWGVPWRLVRVLVSRDRRTERRGTGPGEERPLRVRFALQGVGERVYVSHAPRRFLLADAGAWGVARPK